MNSSNTELFINKIKYEYKKYFIPEKNGEYSIKLKFKINLTDSSFMFAGCDNIKSIFFSLRTDFVTNMKYMFNDCKNMKHLDLSSFDTRNVADMSHMFANCNQLKNLDLSSFDTRNVTDMSHMFADCNQLKNLNLSNFDTRNVTDMSHMFSRSKNLTNINVNSFNTENVKYLNNMLYECLSLNCLNVSSFNIKNAIKIDQMFFGCKNLAYLDFSSFDIKNIENYYDIDLIFKIFLFDKYHIDTKISYLEKNIIFISELKEKYHKEYLLNKIKSIKYFDQEVSIIKCGQKIISFKGNKRYVLNLIDYSDKNKFLNIDSIIMEYDVNDKKSFDDLEYCFNNNNYIINKTNLIYLIGINFLSSDKKIISGANKFSEKHKIKHISLSSQDNYNIKDLLNTLFKDLGNTDISYESGHFNYKIIMLGDDFVGKTSLSKRIKNDTFDLNQITTIGVDSFIRTINTKSGKKIEFIFYDTPGQERFISLAKTCLKKSDCAILIYDVTDKNSFDFVIQQWYKSILDFKEIQLIYLIGNKLDLISNGKRKREVYEEEALKFSIEHNLRYFEISCLEKTNIEKFFSDLVDEISKIKPCRKPKNEKKKESKFFNIF